MTKNQLVAFLIGCSESEAEEVKDDKLISYDSAQAAAIHFNKSLALDNIHNITIGEMVRKMMAAPR